MVGQSRTDGLVLHYDGQDWTDISPDNVLDIFVQVWAYDANNVFAIGQNGTAMQYDGQVWTDISPSPTVGLADVWGEDPNNVFVVGSNGLVKRYNGQGWDDLSPLGVTASLVGVWGIDTGDVFVVGQGGTVMRYHDMAWEPVPLPGPRFHGPSVPGVGSRARGCIRDWSKWCDHVLRWPAMVR